MRLAASEYQSLDLWSHSFLRDVPLHDAFVLDLPGGGKGRYMALIKPFRHWVVYPAMLNGIRKAWIRKYGEV